MKSIFIRRNGVEVELRYCANWDWTHDPVRQPIRTLTGNSTKTHEVNGFGKDSPNRQ